MRDRTVLVTGANKGVGYEIARQLGAHGYAVWVGSRNRERGQASVGTLLAEGHDVRMLPMDVTDDDSVATAMETVRAADGKLDVLINNAGIAGESLTAPSMEPLKNVRAVYETNVFGVIRVTQAFLPLLKAGRDAQIVMLSSGLGSLGLLSDPASRVFHRNFMGYDSSKTALNALTVAFAKELSVDGIAVNSVDPGYTATDFTGHEGRPAADAASSIVWLINHHKPLPSGSFFYNREPQIW